MNQVKYIQPILIQIEKVLTNHLLSGMIQIIFTGIISLTWPYNDYEYYTIKIPMCSLSSREI